MTNKKQDFAGTLFLITGLSGGGKTSVCNAAISKFPQITKIISYTTRQPRKGEISGQDYIFVSNKEFDRLKEAGKILEKCAYADHFYGTPNLLQFNLTLGNDCAIVVTLSGALSLKQIFPKSFIVFVTTPSLKEAEKRIRARGDDEALINQRLLENKKDYNLFKQNIDAVSLVITNKKFERSVDELIAFFGQTRL